MPLIRSKDVELFYDLTGPAGAPVILFSHSIGATLDMWDAQVPPPSPGAISASATTPAGMAAPRSSTARPGSTISPTTWPGVLDALGIAKAHVVGLSLGGMTAQAFALRHADRLERLLS